MPSTFRLSLSPAATHDILEFRRCNCNALKPKDILGRPNPLSAECRYVLDADGFLFTNRVRVRDYGARVIEHRLGLEDRSRSQKSLLVGTNFPVPERREFTRQDPRLGFGRVTSPAAETRFAAFPCIFPVDQGFAPRDEFATDCTLRQVLGSVSLLSFRSVFETRAHSSVG